MSFIDPTWLHSQTVKGLPEASLSSPFAIWLQDNAEDLGQKDAIASCSLNTAHDQKQQSRQEQSGWVKSLKVSSVTPPDPFTIILS